MKVLITMMGRSVWGLVNSVWAAARNYGYVPERVHILTARKNLVISQIASEMLKVILGQFGPVPEISLEEVEGGDVQSISSRVRNLVESYGGENEIALDVTSGTKDLVLGSVLVVDKSAFRHVFYLQLDNLKNVSRPYVLIPLEMQHCHDILKEAR